MLYIHMSEYPFEPVTWTLLLSRKAHVLPSIVPDPNECSATQCLSYRLITLSSDAIGNTLLMAVKHPKFNVVFFAPLPRCLPDPLHSVPAHCRDAFVLHGAGAGSVQQRGSSHRLEDLPCLQRWVPHTVWKICRHGYPQPILPAI